MSVPGDSHAHIVEKALSSILTAVAEMTNLVAPLDTPDARRIQKILNSIEDASTQIQELRKRRRGEPG